MNLNVIIPYSSEYYNIDLLEATLDSLKNFNSSVHTIIITKEDLIYKNCEIVKFDFKNIFSAFNKGISTAKNGFIQFVTPGDIYRLSKNHFDISKSYDIVQFSHDRLDDSNVSYCPAKCKISLQYDLDEIPANMEIVCDKFYRLSFLKNYKIKFRNVQKATKLFNLECLSHTGPYCCIDQLLLSHKVGLGTGLLADKPVKESKLFRDLKFPGRPVLDKYAKDLATSICKVDFVFPYVTSDDDAWKEGYKKALTGEESAWAAGVERFRDNGMLKYVFRSIEKCLPWIDTVHMLVASESQVPSWINRKQVDIITHEEFIPKNLLPCFNSSTIEMFLPELPFRVGNNFIYSNDDLITFKELPIDYFFNDDFNPVYNINLRDFVSTAPGDILRRNCYNLIMNCKQKDRVATTQHGTISYKKNWLKDCYNTYKQEILDSCTAFRDDKNFNQYMYALYQMLNRTIINSEKKIVSFTAKPSQINKILKEDFTELDFVCINDNNETKEEDWKKIIDKIDKLFPEKSKYEI